MTNFIIEEWEHYLGFYLYDLDGIVRYKQRQKIRSAGMLQKMEETKVLEKGEVQL